MPATDNARLVIVSGPSGAGKTTVLQRVVQTCPLPLKRSVSATTRPPRRGEIDGVDYYFLAKQEFDQRRQRGDFLECVDVFGRGFWYGTLWTEVTSGLTAGKWVILEIDVQGALAAMDRYSDAVTVFLRPSSGAELERRLRSRGTETEEAIQRRLQQAREELTFADRYRYQVINDDLPQAVREICHILTQELEADRNAR